MDCFISDTQDSNLHSYLDRIRARIKEMSVEELQRVSCNIYAKISECYIIGDLKNYTRLEYVRAMVDDEIIIRRVNNDIQDRLVQCVSLWNVSSWDD